MLGVILSGATQVPMGMAADRLDKRRLTGLGGVIAGVGLGAIQWAESYAGLAALIIVFGIGGGICMAAHMALGVRKGGRMNSMGSVMAILTAAHSLGMMAGALIAGVAMDVVGLRAVFPLGSAIMLLCTLIFLIGSARGTGADARSN
jgi:MFS family permease